jgi:DNA-binding response OmpR family regulator
MLPLRERTQMKRILVVDDEPNIRLNYRVLLEVDGFQVSEASNGAAALDQLRNGRFALALLDLRMPAMDGLQLLAALRRHAIITPAIIVTAFDDVPSEAQAMRLGAIDFLRKPVRPADLRAVITEVLERHDPSTHVETADDFRSHLIVAKRLINLCDFNEAQKHALRALELNHAVPEAFNLAGVLAEVLGDYTRAMKLYERTLRVDGQHGPAKRNLHRLSAILESGFPEEHGGLASLVSGRFLKQK